MLELSDVLEIVRSEFSPLLGKFAVYDLTLDSAPKNADGGVNKPGVYILWKECLGVIKVGKSQRNSKARALEHIRDNTRNEKLEMARAFLI